MKNRALLLVSLPLVATAVAFAANLTGLRFQAPVQQAIQRTIAVQSADGEFHSRKLNILLLGYQGYEGNSDTLILAHLDIDRRTATLMSIPRDTRISVPKHGQERSTRPSASGDLL